MTIIILNFFISYFSSKKIVGAMFFALIFGTAYQMGQFDWYSYEYLYAITIKMDFLTAIILNTIGHYEPIFSIALVIGSLFFEDYWVVKTILYFGSFLFFASSLNQSNIKYKRLFCFVFLSLTAYPILYTTDRQAIALLLATGLFMRDKRSALTAGFHLSSLYLYLPTLKIKSIFIFCIPLSIILGFISSKYLYILTLQWPSTSSFIILAGLLILAAISTGNRTRKVLLILFFSTAVLMFFPPIFYRMKVYIVIASCVVLFRDFKFKINRTLGVSMTAMAAVLINFMYIKSDDLAFGAYQTHVLKDYVMYEDKQALWEQRFAAESKR